MQPPKFSVVINTDGRATSLAATLESLRWLNAPPFEVCVVSGPTPDGTDEVLARWKGQVKTACCGERNLSVSRNIGITIAAGEVVAFLDDDAIPEPEWLLALAQAYADPAVGGAGGFVYNPDGVTYQYRFGIADRLGRADLTWTRPAPEFAFPFSASYPHLLGANSSFRRNALTEIGGFDEEFEYFLDETDVAARVTDACWRIVQIGGAHVHHKYAPSALRNEARVLTSWYSVIKNRIYFGMVNGLLHHSVNTIIAEARSFIHDLERDMEWAIASGRLKEMDRNRFWLEVDRAWRDGLLRGLAGRRRIPGPERFTANPPPPFLPFYTNAPPTGRRCFCFLTQEFPPAPVGGIGRYLDELSRGIAALGHHVHVLTGGHSHDRVDFQDGVWVHRLVTSPEDTVAVESLHVPERVGSHAARMRREVAQIALKRPLDAVYAPIWDCEGLAVLADGAAPLVVGLQTTLRFWLDSNPQYAADPTFMESFVKPMLAAETRLLTEAAGVHAISAAIAEKISGAYGVDLAGARIGVVPLGLADWTRLPAASPPPVPKGALRLLFVGRLESRKGIDVLLAAVARVLARNPSVYLDLVGNDRINGPDGRTYRAAFEADPATTPIRDRVRFHGLVSEEALRGFYAACDIVVTPSRFESFGLMLLEGMMFGKPVIGCRAGGMTEVVEDGVSGMLVDPGDVDSLELCIERLVADAPLRARLGGAARARFEQRFSAEAMARDVASLLARTADAWQATRAAA